MSTLTGTVRELACLALGHDDGDEPRCRHLDEQLVRQLIDEVQQLRVAAGLVEATEADRQEQEAAVVDAIASTMPGPIDPPEAADLIAALAGDGWQLVRVRRP